MPSCVQHPHRVTNADHAQIDSLLHLVTKRRSDTEVAHSMQL